MHAAIQNMFDRRSIRAYTSDPVSEEDIQLLLEAAMAAPSGRNDRPWHFIIVKERETLDKLADVAGAYRAIKQAPVCFCVAGDHEKSNLWDVDCASAVTNILNAATALGLGSLWMGVSHDAARTKQVRDLLSIPENVTPLALVAIGHPAEEKESRTQYEESAVHHEKW